MFDNMISKSLIQVLWVLLSIGVVIFGFVNYIGTPSYQKSIGLFLGTLFGTAIGLLIIRVICEQIIVIFMMHEELYRSRVAMEQIQSDQYAMRQSLHSFAAQAAPLGTVVPNALSSQPRRSGTTSSTSQPAAPIIGTRPASSGWGGAYGSSALAPDTTTADSGESRS